MQSVAKDPPPTPWSAALVAAVLSIGVACQEASSPDAAVRVHPVPAAVHGLGPAVFVTSVLDEQRNQRVGLRAIARLGDDIGKAGPVRRSVEVALGDPRFPSLADGKADEQRDAVLSGGRVLDATLPDHTILHAAFRAALDLSIITSTCLTVRADGRIHRPGEHARCYPAELGGVYWQEGNGHRYGGIDLRTGAATGGLDLPARPIAVSADGKVLVAVEGSPEAHIGIADTRSGRVKMVSATLAGLNPAGVLTEAGFAVLLHDGDERALALVGLDGAVRTLMKPVGQVAFSPDGRHALAVVDERGEQPRLTVVDLPGGGQRPVDGALPVGGEVTAIVAGHQALVLSLGPPGVDPASRPARGRVVDLTTAKQRAVAVPERATKAQIARPGESTATDVAIIDQVFAPLEVTGLASASLFPGGDVVTISADGTVATAPPNAVPFAALPGGRVLYRRTVGQRHRHDLLLVIDRAGKRFDLRTGAAKDQRIGELVPTPDGQHLLVSLHPDTARFPDLGPKNETVLVRLDGAGDPLVLYRGVILASLGLAR